MRGRQVVAALDVEQSHHVALVSETLAKSILVRRSHLAGPSACLDCRLSRFPSPIRLLKSSASWEIWRIRVRASFPPQVFVPFAALGQTGFGLVMRTADDPMRMVEPLRREIQAIQPRRGTCRARHRGRPSSRTRSTRARASACSSSAFLPAPGSCSWRLACMACSPTPCHNKQRRSPSAWRSAASAVTWCGWSCDLGLQLVGVGLIIGVAASLATNRLLVSQLWNTSPNDPTTFGVVLTASSL